MATYVHARDIFSTYSTYRDQRERAEVSEESVRCKRCDSCTWFRSTTTHAERGDCMRDAPDTNGDRPPVKWSDYCQHWAAVTGDEREWIEVPELYREGADGLV